MAVGRISGPLLKDNLLRNGVNLAFETNLLYLDVVNSRVGINTNSPTNDLSVNGTTRTTNLYASTQANLGLLQISGSTISSNNSTITLTPTGTNAGGTGKLKNARLRSMIPYELGAELLTVVDNLGTNPAKVRIIPPAYVR